MLPEITGLPLAAAEEALRQAGLAYTVVRTSSPFRHEAEAGKTCYDYAVRFKEGELICVSFPIQAYTED